jgi:hypothetical protein
MNINQGSMAIARVRTSRRYHAGGGMAAMSLGELQGAKRELTGRVCKHHVWRIRKWSRECTRCGLLEDREPGSKGETQGNAESPGRTGQ